MNQRTVHIPAIGCEGCLRAIKSALSGIEGVQSVQADLATKTVTVTWDERTTWEAIRACLVEINYPPQE
ncbi:MAG: heavy-metal-associated domain-containing protein [Thermoflexales bacterium]|nr:heavy-metal-associated domain-containing protein [Thermoflexales bacterium]MCX7938607.1 heavy-metal-associated domain-containing protein [Thermoflexales bacterium]MDW8053722.1 heavy-metal-associated domain-containing protein [Anaerolineae bacterium]MDW8293023.1 heavy-metal-associated domain-containing protein [Anaerolineae bacterium]